MKRVLIFAYNMHIGGVQKSLLNLLTILSPNYDITLFLFSDKGAYLPQIPKTVNIVFPKKKFFVIGMSQKELLRESFSAFFVRVLLKIGIFFFGRERILKRFLKECPLEGSYDVSISYQQNGPGNSMLFGANDCCLRTKAKTKIAFLHSDFEKAGTLTASNIEEYKKFDFLFSVSETGNNTLSKFFDPTKLRVCKNVHDIEGIKALSEGFDVKKENVCSFVTVSRISEEKGIDRIIGAVSRLNSMGFQFIWRVIGDGPLLKKFQGLKDGLHLNNLSFEGAKENPYPFILASDYLVITSRHEAAPMVVQEAQILDTNVLSVNYSSAKEFINEESVCANDDNALVDLLASAIKRYPKIVRSFRSGYTEENNNENLIELIRIIESS